MGKSLKRTTLDSLPAIVREGGWIDIGHDSAIKLSGRSLLHRCNGRVARRPVAWLVEELPLLNWILHRESEKGVDLPCQPA